MSVNYKTLKMLSYSVFFMTALISLTFFVSEKTSRIIFYSAGYISFFSYLFLCINYGIKKSTEYLSLPLLFLGITFFFWSLTCTIFGDNSNYLLYTPAKRMFVSFLIMNVLISSLKLKILDKEKIVFYSKIALWLTLIISSIYGVYLSSLSNGRVNMGIDRPTMTAYAYSTLSLSLLILASYINRNLLKTLLFIIISSISIYVIFHTQTRAAMGVHTLAVIAITLFTISLKRNPIGLIAILISILLTIFGNYNIVTERSAQAIADVNMYHGKNDRSSLGARFTMWEVGLVAFKNMPLGETLNYRNDYIKNYLDNEGQENSDALTYLHIHLHNEAIQYLSIFGIVGIIVLVFFYYIYTIYTTRKYGLFNPVSIPMLAIVIYGLTDVLLTSGEFLIILMSVITLNLLIMDKKISIDSIRHQH